MHFSDELSTKKITTPTTPLIKHTANHKVRKTIKKFSAQL